MSGPELRAARATLRLTQMAAARRWRVSQAYLSLMEQGRRPVPERVARLAARASPDLATGLVLDPARVTARDVERQLGHLGYPGFAYLGEPHRAANPAAVVLGALRAEVMSARVAEALPWVLVTYPHMDWNWLVDHARLANCQNRLGFLVTLARQLAERRGEDAVRSLLQQVEQQLEDARLVKEDTLGRALTEVERAHLRTSRPEAAAHWNVLTSLRVDQLRYAH